VPFIAIILVCVAIATVAAWYLLLRSPASAPSATAAPSPTPARPPATVAQATSPVPTAPPSVAPTLAPAAAPTPTRVSTPVAAPATPAPTPTPAVARPTPAPAARPAPPRTTPVPAAGDARALLAQGAYPDAARAFAASLAGSRGRFSLQVLVACAPENVQKAVSAVPVEQLFILPVNVKGKDCYRLCWGVYDGRPEAEAALGALPSYFRQGGVTPRLSPLAELLP
jgi:septal ring-binding cell division protein DamX